MTDIERINETLFESIKHVNEYGQEYWTARELQTALDYKKWEKFSNIIEKAKDACNGSGNAVSDHFPQTGKIVAAGATTKEIEDYHLSRYACYLIAMNGSPKKEAVALAQTYFAVKTRQQQLIEQYESMSEDEKRLDIRKDIIKHNKSLADAAHDAGVIQPVDYARFQNAGYMGLYNGETQNDIHRRKGLKKSQKILDYMGGEELGANLFRITQTDAKLRRENIQGRENATATHYEVGRKVRQTIAELGGTMPEDLPTPEKSVKQIEREQKKAALPKGSRPDEA